MSCLASPSARLARGGAAIGGAMLTTEDGATGRSWTTYQAIGPR